MTKWITIPPDALNAANELLSELGYIRNSGSFTPKGEKSYNVYWIRDTETGSFVTGKRKIVFHDETPDEFLLELALRFS